MTQTTIETPARAPEASRARVPLPVVLWGACFTAVVALLALVTCLVSSDPAGNFLVTMVLLFLWPVLGLIWFVGAVIELVLAITRRSFQPRRWLWLVASALIVVITAGLVVGSVPLKARFALSKSAMNDRVATADELADLTALPVEEFPETNAARLGLYRFERIERVGDDVFFTVGSAGLAFDEAGFAYSAEGTPSEGELGDGYSYEYEALGDGWYSFYAAE